MNINEELKLVVPVGNGFAYHTPIAQAVFEANYRILAAVKAQLASKGLVYQMDSGPRIAAMLLRDEGKKDAEQSMQEGDGGAESLLQELTRLTTAIVPGPSGYETLPVATAIAKGALDADDWKEALSELVFFTCHYALAKKAMKSQVANAIASVLTASITSSLPTVYASSLPPLTTEKPSPVVASSVPR